MKSLAFLLALLSLIGCGQAPDADTVIDADLRPFVDEFEAEAAKRHLVGGERWHIISITEGKTDVDSDLGDCTDGVVTITARAKAKGEADLRATIWHEVAHCRYHVQHDPAPGRIMSAVASPAALVDWPARTDELFTFIGANLTKIPND